MERTEPSTSDSMKVAVLERGGVERKELWPCDGAPKLDQRPPLLVQRPHEEASGNVEMKVRQVHGIAFDLSILR